MIVSLSFISLGILYFTYKKELIVVVIFSSIILQYHVRYFLYLYLDFANFALVYGDRYGENLDDINSYLDILLTHLVITFLILYNLKKKNTHIEFINFKITGGSKLNFIIMSLLLLYISIDFRFINQLGEENFSTITQSFMNALLCFSGLYFKGKNVIRSPVFHLLLASCIFMGFRSLLFTLFLSIFIAKRSKLDVKFIVTILIFVSAIVGATALRGGAATSLFTTLFSIATSHYDSWSYLVISFDISTINKVENLQHWLIAFVSLLPGAKRLFGIETYGHYLNKEYASEWFELVNTILPAGLVGEAISLGFWVPFIFLPFVVFIYFVAGDYAKRNDLPFYTLFVIGSFFLIESTITNLGGFIKIAILIYLIKLAFRARFRPATT